MARAVKAKKFSVGNLAVSIVPCGDRDLLTRVGMLGCIRNSCNLNGTLCDPAGATLIRCPGAVASLVAFRVRNLKGRPLRHILRQLLVLQGRAKGPKIRVIIATGPRTAKPLAERIRQNIK